jgi:hypothetical protein
VRFILVSLWIFKRFRPQIVEVVWSRKLTCSVNDDMLRTCWKVNHVCDSKYIFSTPFLPVWRHFAISENSFHLKFLRNLKIKSKRILKRVRGTGMYGASILTYETVTYFKTCCVLLIIITSKINKLIIVNNPVLTTAVNRALLLIDYPSLFVIWMSRIDSLRHSIFIFLASLSYCI